MIYKTKILIIWLKFRRIYHVLRISFITQNAVFRKWNYRLSNITVIVFAIFNCKSKSETGFTLKATIYRSKSFCAPLGPFQITYTLVEFMCKLSFIFLFILVDKFSSKVAMFPPFNTALSCATVCHCQYLLYNCELFSELKLLLFGYSIKEKYFWFVR